MENYSFYIKKNIDDIEKAGYTIEQNGKQLRKSVDEYEILITDLTTRSLLTNVKILLIWIKNKETKIIEQEKYFKNELLPLPFNKVNLSAEKMIAKLKNTKKRSYVLKNTIIDIDYNMAKDNVKKSIG